MDRDLFPERVAYRPGPILTGRVVRLLTGYPRDVKVSQPILVAVLATAGVTRLIGLLLVSLLQAGSGRGGVRRRWKEMRKGPEFLVTPMRIRDADGVLCEIEIHGHLPQSALQPGDHVQVTVRQQKDSDLPPRAERLVNLTTGQLLTPRIATVWSHLGPALLLQALCGVALVASIASCAVAVT
jgi:hypothetical protein